MARKRKEKLFYNCGIMSQSFYADDASHFEWTETVGQILKSYGIKDWDVLIVEPDNPLDPNELRVVIVKFKFTQEQADDMVRNGIQMTQGPEYLGTNFYGDLVPKTM